MTRKALLVCAAALAGSATLAGDRNPAAFTVVDGTEIPDPLAEAGDPARGAAVAADPALGGCLACHGADGPAGALSGLAERRSVGRLRLSLVDLGLIAPGVEGHAFYVPVGAADGPEPPRTRLTAQEIEDVLAWLLRE